MPTVIDALIVTLRLDTAGMKKGRAEADDDLRKTREAATVTAKEMELRGKQAADFFSRVKREALGLFAVLAAGRGIKDFVRDITGGDAATGRLAHQLGISVEQLSAWEGAVVRAGGTAAGFDSTISGLTSEFEHYALTGASRVAPFFAQMNIALVDSQQKLRPVNDLLLDLADRFSRMDPRRATEYGRLMGLDQGTVNLLMQGRAEVEKLLAAQVKLGLPSGGDAKRAQSLLNHLADLQQGVQSLARTVLNDLSPDIDNLLGRMDAWLQANREWLAAKISDAIRDIRDAVASIDWAKVGTDLAAFGHAVDDVVQRLGGWKTVTEVIFGLWALSKLAPILTGLGLIRGALVATTGAAAGLLGMLGRVAVGAWAAHEGLKAIDPEDKFGSWIDSNVPGAGAVDDWFARTFGIGRTFEQQRQAAGPDAPKDEAAASRTIARGVAQGMGQDGAQARLLRVLDRLGTAVERLMTWLDRQGAGGASGEQASDLVATPGERARAGVAMTGAGGAGNAYRPGTAEQQRLAAQARDYFQGQGYTREQAAGLVHNLLAESGLYAGARGDNGQASGIAQWHPDRVQKILAGAGIDVRTAPFEDQLRAVAWELRGPERAAGDALRGAGSAQAAGGIVSRRYERPGMTEEDRAREESARASGADALYRRWGRQAALSGYPGAGRPGLAGSMIAMLEPGGPGGGRAGGANTDNSSTTHINGPITVQTRATDAAGIARDLRGELARRALVAQANTGLS